jgi:hypothetical protein
MQLVFLVRDLEGKSIPENNPPAGVVVDEQHGTWRHAEKDWRLGTAWAIDKYPRGGIVGVFDLNNPEHVRNYDMMLQILEHRA